MPYRPNQTSFKPGKSGNPGGLPLKVRKAVKHARLLTAAKLEPILQRVIRLALTTEDEKLMLQAAAILFDRAGFTAVKDASDAVAEKPPVAPPKTTDELKAMLRAVNDG